MLPGFFQVPTRAIASSSCQAPVTLGSARGEENEQVLSLPSLWRQSCVMFHASIQGPGSENPVACLASDLPGDRTDMSSYSVDLAEKSLLHVARVVQ